MDLLLDLDAAPGRSLRARAEHALREAVRSGRLVPGTRLPATRALAAQLGVSRGVVVDAYAQLAAEGYLVTRRGGGTTVASGVGARSGAAEGAGVPDGDGAAGGGPRAGERAGGGGAGAGRAGGVAAWGRTLDGVVYPQGVRHDLRPALPSLSGFPRAAWAAATARVLRSLPDERLGYPDPAGAPELRETLAAYLGRVRGVRAEPGQVLVTAGLRQGLDALWAALADAGVRRVAIERPGWRGWTQTAAAAGLTGVPLAVDADGAVVDGIEALDVDAAAVTPAHQYPTGAVLSSARRGRLVAWAQRRGGVIVEDDYDAEFRYDRQPVGSLQGLAPDVVVYGGTASKSLVPAIRLAWLVLPPALVEPVLVQQRRRGGAPAIVDQLVLAELLERGEVDRHLRRMRRRYRRQRDALLAAVARELPDVRVEGVAAGLHAVLRLPPTLEEAAVVRAARDRGVALDGMGEAATGGAGPAPSAGPALVVGYANLPEAAVAPAVAALAEAVRAASGGAGREGVR